VKEGYCFCRFARRAFIQRCHHCLLTMYPYTLAPFAASTSHPPPFRQRCPDWFAHDVPYTRRTRRIHLPSTSHPPPIYLLPSTSKPPAVHLPSTSSLRELYGDRGLVIANEGASGSWWELRELLGASAGSFRKNQGASRSSWEFRHLVPADVASTGTLVN